LTNSQHKFTHSNSSPYRINNRTKTIGCDCCPTIRLYLRMR